MAHKPAVHIELREEGWAVVREGNKRASSTHATQSEAAESGREIARREQTEFFLHAQDGKIREHRDYREVQTSTDKGIVDQASETVGSVASALTGTTGAAAQAVGAGGPERKTEPGAATNREADQSESVTDSDSSGGTYVQEGGDTEEVRSLTDAEREERFGAPEVRYADYEIYDQDGERIGPLNDLFVDENDEPEYVGVGTGSPDNRSVLAPAEAITVDDRLRRMVISQPKSMVEAGPSLGYEDEVTPEFERRVRVHYGLETPSDTGDRAGYGAYYRDDAELTDTGSADPMTHLPGYESVPEDEVRVQRSEEEIRVETREREAGAMRVRKRVRTDRERIVVPKKRVEVTVERVPVEGGAVPTGEEAAATPEIEEDEIVVPIIEEEIVVEKRPVVKEEIRIRKEIVEDMEVVEEDVRREEVEIDDQTDRNPESHAGQELENNER
jgi:uncharacterized protein (TIGR02271 family)